jgi:signal peptidase I
MKQVLIFFWEVIEIAIIAFASVFIIRTFIVQPFLVRGASMEPSFLNGDYLLIDEISMRFRDIRRGEAVVFRFPRDPNVFYIKRVIGLPNETVVIKDNTVTIKNSENPEGFVIQEPYVQAGGVTGEEEVTFLVKENEYLAMGDNRSYSYDSRSWGAVPKDDIIGLVRIRLWPLSDLSLMEAPAY